MNIRELPSTIQLTRNFVSRVETELPKMNLNHEQRQVISVYVKFIESELKFENDQINLDGIQKWILGILSILPKELDTFKKDKSLFSVVFQNGESENDTGVQLNATRLAELESTLKNSRNVLTLLIGRWANNTVISELNRLSNSREWKNRKQNIELVKGSIGNVVIRLFSGKYAEDPTRAYIEIINILSSTQKIFPQELPKLSAEIFKITQIIDEKTFMAIENAITVADMIKRARACQ